MQKSILGIALSSALFCCTVVESADLSAVATAEITREYQKRFLAEIKTFEDAMSGYIASTGERGFQFQMPRSLSDEEVSAIDELIKGMEPFVSAGDKLAKAITASAYHFRHQNRPDKAGYDCKMLNMIYEVTASGSAEAAALLARIYSDGDIIPRDTQLAYLWAREAERRQTDAGKPALSGVSEGEIKKMQSLWDIWSPHEAINELIANNSCSK
jgi:TPR repeat protein